MRSLSLIAILSAASACTLTRTDFTECSSNQDCAAVFGVGSTCDSDGLCEATDGLARCDTTFPDDLFTNQDNSDAIVFGNLMDQSISAQVGRQNAAELTVLTVLPPSFAEGEEEQQK